ncbi:MAG: transporter [Betaproteobacteria bacterium]|nr:transporter [Betaproteobacteria bacterium]
MHREFHEAVTQQRLDAVRRAPPRRELKRESERDEVKREIKHEARQRRTGRRLAALGERTAAGALWLVLLLACIAVLCGILIVSEGARTLVGYESVGQKLDRGIAHVNGLFANTGETAQNKVTAAGEKVQNTGRELNNSAVAAFDKGAARVDAAGDAVRQRAEALGAGVSDAGITASIKADLIKDPYLSATRIEVDTREGVVTLSGSAGSDASRERAGRMASAIAGVKQVNNQLTVASNSATR